MYTLFLGGIIMMTNTLKNISKEVQEKVLRFQQMTPAEKSKMGITPFGRIGTGCPSVYFHDDANSDGYEYNIGRDC